MTGNVDSGAARASRVRIAMWAAAALVLLLPLVVLQVRGQEGWEVADFAVPAALLFGTGLAFELLGRMRGRAAYRAALGVAVAAALLLVWMNLAVGIIGSEDNPANLLYFGALAVGLVGAVIARFRAQGMARAMLATAGALLLVGVIALVAGFGEAGPLRWAEVLGLSGYFAALFAGSAWLFNKAV
jgi:hypothetical protein